MAKRVGACLVWGQSLPNCDVRVTSAYPLCVQPVSATPLAVYRLTTLGRIYEYTPSSMRACARVMGSYLRSRMVNRTPSC
jgi:hypothetical protein